MFMTFTLNLGQPSFDFGLQPRRIFWKMNQKQF